jgi:tripartite ATP-independent transporter DctM subunit
MVASAFLLLIALLALSVPVAASLGVLGLLLSQIYSPVPLSLALGEVAWGASTSFILVAVPFFVLLGEILLRSGIAERMYGAMAQWVSWLPGGLMHANVGACSLFAATCGSSVATAATIGTVAVNLIERNRYNERIFLGSLAAGGTLGILIPPSINLIVYGVLTETSIPKLFLAGVIPGLVLAAAFMLTILIACLIRPSWGGRRIETSWPARLRSLPDLVPPLAIFIIVIGSIYAGWATPTESAALGVVAALVLAACHRRLSLQSLRQAIEGTMTTTAMIMAILIGAYFLNFVIAVIGLTTQVSRFVTALGLSPAEMLFAVIVFYLILGMFMETLSMMVATVPIIAPVVIDMGYDPIWFGIVIVLLIETAMITPPVGINLFVVQGVRGRGEMRDVIIGAAPFVIALLAVLGLIVLLPGLATWLPTVASR